MIKNQNPVSCQHSVPMQSFQNRQTFEQFFEPLYYTYFQVSNATPTYIVLLIQHVRLIMYIYSRSASCPLYSDLDLDFWEGWTFNNRWPLTTDSDSTFYRHLFKVHRMRELPAMIALRSHAKIIGGSEELNLIP